MAKDKLQKRENIKFHIPLKMADLLHEKIKTKIPKGKSKNLLELCDQHFSSHC